MPKRILAIDDTKTMRDMLVRCLSRAGHDVSEAKDGQEGLEVFDREKPDLVITDLNMPIMDGIGFVKGARGRPHGRSIPILILTTETADDLKRRGREAGATGWMVKPFDPKRLLKIVEQVC